MAGSSLQHALYPLLHRHSLAIVTLKIRVHAGPKGDSAHDQVHHAAQLRALFVHSGGVKVVDLDVGLGSDRVREWPRILCKLHRLERAHLLQAAVEA